MKKSIKMRELAHRLIAYSYYLEYADKGDMDEVGITEQDFKDDFNRIIEDEETNKQQNKKAIINVNLQYEVKGESEEEIQIEVGNIELPKEYVEGSYVFVKVVE